MSLKDLTEQVPVNTLVKDVHANAILKGWWENGDRNPLELHMLMVSELAEATECARRDLPPVYYDTADGPKSVGIKEIESGVKPEGELVELADVVIRIMDYCGRKGWDLEAAIMVKNEYNQTRPHRHGGKKF
jgi:hypothetical protein